MEILKNTITRVISGRRRASVALALLCLMQAPTIAFAQMDQGTITGVVQDSTGAVIPGAKVTLTNNGTGLALTTTSDKSGIYIFSPLKIGSYTVNADAPGFKETSQEHVQLNVGDRLNVVLSLTPGATTQTVTVSSAPPLLQTQSSAVEQTLSTRTVNATPLNGRNWVYIAQLTAGVDPATGSRGAGKGDFEANGQDAGQNNFILDGVDNNTSVVDFLNGASFVVRPPPDALEEFKVSTSDYSAEFGHSAGAVVNASLKSGTNQIHGDLWEYFRNNVLDARDFDALTIPKYRQNQFGATLGFPILRNKLFFFADAEANRRVFGETSTETVPTAKMRAGNFSELLNPSLTGQAQPIQLYQPNSGGTKTLSCNGVNNVYCPAQIDPVAARILNLYPAPNANGDLTYNNYIINRNSTDDRWDWDSRVDWNISAKDQAFARFDYLNEPSDHPSPLGPILDGGSYGDDGHIVDLGQDFAASETHIFNPNLTNEFRFSFEYGHFEDAGENVNSDVAPTLGLGGIPFAPNNGGLPSVSISGISSFGTPLYYTADEYQNTYQILDNVTKIVGNHSIKAGVEFESLRFSTLAPPSPRGSYTFNGLYSSNPGVSFTGYGVADFLTDQVNSSSISNLATISDSRWYRAVYAQDDWRVNTRLTVNLGLRYEYFEPIKENSGAQANFYATGPLGVATGTAEIDIPTQAQNISLGAPFLAAARQDNVSVKYVSNPLLTTQQRLNFSPRVGFSYQLSQRAVIRGGFGIFYGGLENVGGITLGWQYPFQYLSSFPAPNCAAVAGGCPSNGYTLETGFSKAIAAGLINYTSTTGFNGQPLHTPNPYTQAENFSFEESITPNLALSAGYVGSVGRHLFNWENQNAPEALLNPGNDSQFVQPFPQFGGDHYMAMAGVNSYNAFQTQLQKRFSGGLNFLATYTWSHSMDDAPTGLGSTGDGGYHNTNLVPIIDNYANSPWDTRQRFTFNGLYDLPFGMERAHLNHAGLANLIAGGWSTDLTFTAQTGNPFTVYPDITTASGSNAFAILKRNPNSAGGTQDPSNPSVSCAVRTRTKTNWFNPCAFANPLAGDLISPGPNAGNPNQPQPGYSYPEYVRNAQQVLAFVGGRRNQIMGPGYERINMSIFKDFATFREEQVEFRADIFNVLNTPAYGDPSVTSDNSNGGQITSPRFFQNYTPDARFFQFSLKYMF